MLQKCTTYIIIVSVLMLCVVLLYNNLNLNVLHDLISYLIIYHVNGQVCVEFAIVYRLFKSTHTIGSLAPLDFSGSVFTCADFQKIAQISSLCDVHYISEEITSLMCLANKSKSTAKLTVHTVGIALKS